MKPVAEMSEAEKAQVREWLHRWERVGPILEEMRWESIRQADTERAISAFDGAFETAIRDLPPKPYSGLVRQQELLGRVPKQESPETVTELERLREKNRKEMTAQPELNPPNPANAQAIPNELLEQPDFTVSAKLAAEVDELISHYPRKRSASLMLLHAVQEHFGYISRQAVEWIASKLELQPINIYELVTFYPMFHHKPFGRYHFRICRTLSCALGGSYELHEFFCKKLGLDPQAHGVQTTKDGRFSIEFVECLASCGTAPVMMCNDTFHEGVSEKKAEEILTQCRS